MRRSTHAPLFRTGTDSCAKMGYHQAHQVPITVSGNIHSHAREIIMTTRRDRNFAFVSIDQNLNREKRFLTLLFEIVLIRIYIYIYVFKDYDTFFKDSGTNILRINISIRTFT